MKKPEFGPGDVILEIKSNIHKIILRKDTLEIYRGELHFIFDLEEITSITPVKGSGGLFTAKPAEIRIVGQPRSGVGPPIWPISFQYNQNDEINKFVDTFYETQRSYLQRKVDREERREKERLTRRAKERERALDYDSAIRFWEELGEIEEAARVRKLKTRQGSVRVAQKVVHGDEITKTDIRDSVVSKSSIGAGGDGDDLAAKLQQLAQMHGDGILSDEQFETAKNKLLN